MLLTGVLSAIVLLSLGSADAITVTTDISTTTKAPKIHTCACHSKCKDNIKIHDTKPCPKCDIKCPTCPPCEVCVTSTTIPPSTALPPSTGRCSDLAPGYTYVEDIGRYPRCLRIGGNMSVHASLDDDLCGPGAELMYPQNSEEIEDYQLWVWGQLESEHVPFWTSGRGYTGEGYKWMETSMGTINLDAYSWEGPKPDDETYCLSVSALTGQLKGDDCTQLALHYVCQKMLEELK